MVSSMEYEREVVKLLRDMVPDDKIELTYTDGSVVQYTYRGLGGPLIDQRTVIPTFNVESYRWLHRGSRPRYLAVGSIVEDADYKNLPVGSILRAARYDEQTLMTSHLWLKVSDFNEPAKFINMAHTYRTQTGFNTQMRIISLGVPGRDKFRVGGPNDYSD